MNGHKCLASEVFREPIAQFYQQFEREAQKKFGKSWKQINAQCEEVCGLASFKSCLSRLETVWLIFI